VPEPRQIDKAKQLLVEGRSAEAFFNALLSNRAISDIQVQNFGGNNELPGFLRALRLGPGFVRQVVSLGIIRDAETNAEAAFQSVCGALQWAHLAVPEQVMSPVGMSPRVSVLILPDATTPGMLETVCLQAVADDPVMECLNQYFSCMEQCLNVMPNNIPKARIQAFLASRHRPGLLPGEAASAGYWPWHSTAFDNIKRFLQLL
jgi:hypothetical protein